MATSTLYQQPMLNSQPWMSTNTNIYSRGSSFSYSQQREKISETIGNEMNNSTTLFPMRACSSSTSTWEKEQSKQQLQSNNTNKQVVVNLVRRWPPHHCDFASLVDDEETKPDINTRAIDYGYGNKSPIIPNTSASLDISSPYSLPATSSTSTGHYQNVLNSSLKENTRYPEVSSNLKQNLEVEVSPNKKKLSLGKIPNFAKCYSCERRVKEDHFSEHLFFGSIVCTKCNVHYRDCGNFQIWLTDSDIGNNCCDHSFSYFDNPVDFINSKLSEDFIASKNSDLQDPFTISEKFLANLEKYVLKLRSLETTQPWKYAIEKCKHYLVKEKEYCSSRKEGDFDNYEGASETATSDEIFALHSTNIISALLESNNTRQSKDTTIPTQQLLTDINNSEVLQDKTVICESFNSQKISKVGVQKSPQPHCSWQNPDEFPGQSSDTITNAQQKSPQPHSSWQNPEELTRHSSDTISGVTYGQQSSPQPHCSWQTPDQLTQPHCSWQIPDELSNHSSDTISGIAYGQENSLQPHRFWQNPDELTGHSSDAISRVTHGQQNSPYSHNSWQNQVVRQTDNTNESNNRKCQKDSKKKSKNNRKRTKQTTIQPYKKNRETGGILLKYVSLPSDGHYFISQSPVEQCPDCSERLCPTQFSVNVNTFLITGNCGDCGCYIYIVNDAISIFTEEQKKDDIA